MFGRLVGAQSPKPVENVSCHRDDDPTKVSYVILQLIYYIGDSVKGDSGRIVIEVDPDLKRRLYSALAMNNLTLKQWFIELAQQHLSAQAVSSSPARRLKSKQTK